MKNIVNYIGSKQRYIRQIDQYIPKDIDTYYELFLGSGAVMFHVLETTNMKRAIVTDINPDLINVFVQLKRDPDELNKKLQYLDKRKSRKHFVKYRQTFKSGINTSLNAAKFIYFTKLSFRSRLYNTAGKLYPSYGEPRTLIDPNFFIRKSLLLSRVEIYCKSIFDVLTDFKFTRKDFVFLDPPYITDQQVYKENSITLDFILNLCNELEKQNVKFILTMNGNVKNDFKHFKIVELENKKLTLGQEKVFKEILITNQNL